MKGVTEDPPPAPPTHIWVKPGGSGDGTAADSPLGSFADALTNVKPGMTIVLRGGSYEEKMAGHTHYLLQTSGTASKWIKIEAYPGEVPVLKPISGSGLEIIADYVSVTGLTIEGAGDARQSDYGFGIAVRGHHIKLFDNTISGVPGGGITGGHAAHLWIQGNVIYNNNNWAENQASGISTWEAAGGDGTTYPGGYRDRIIGNTIYNNEVLVPNANGHFTDGNGIILDNNNTNGYAGPTLIANNVVYANGGAGVVVLNSDNVDVVHNTFSGNVGTQNLLGGGGEVAVTFSSANVYVANNIIDPREGIRAFQFYQAAATTENNLVAEKGVSETTSSDKDLLTQAIEYSGAGAAEGSQYAPAPGSPAIDQAIPLEWAPISDRFGLRRPTSSGPDIGAIESTVAASPPAAESPAASTSTTIGGEAAPPATEPAADEGASGASTTKPAAQSGGSTTQPANNADREPATTSEIELAGGPNTPDSATQGQFAEPPAAASPSINQAPDDQAIGEPEMPEILAFQPGSDQATTVSSTPGRATALAFVLLLALVASLLVFQVFRPKPSGPSAR